VPAHVGWEVVVVNNNSTDNTDEIIEKFREHLPVPLKRVFEPQQGLSAARNAGLRAAVGEFIAYTDDDCLVDPDWLARIAQAFANDPQLAGVGGRIELRDPRDIPTTTRPSPTPALISSGSQVFYSIAGCNMAFKREVFDAVGLFDPNFGAGTPLPAEDSDFLYRAIKAGSKLMYLPDVVVRHDHGRREEWQAQELRVAYVTGRGGMYCKHILAGDGAVAKMAYWETRQLVSGILRGGLVGARAREDRIFLTALLRGAWLNVRARRRDRLSAQ